MTAAGIVFLIILFGLNIWFIYFKFRQNEIILKTDLAEAKAKLFTEELKNKNLTSGGLMQTTAATVDNYVNDNLDLGMLRIDTTGIIKNINNHALKILGISKEQAINHQIKSILVLLDSSDIVQDNIYTDALSSKSQSFPFPLFLKTGHDKINVSGKIISLKSPVGNNFGSLFVFFTLNQEKVKDEKSDFFSLAAHELKTPLSTIKNSSALLLDQWKNIPAEKVEELIRVIKDATEQTLNLVGDVLNVTKIDQGYVKTDSKMFDIIKLIDEVLVTYTPLIKEKHLFLEFNKSELGIAKVFADQSRTKEIIINLISNAVKYTFQGGIKIRCFTHEEGVAVEVEDTGVGIAKENERLLFRKFQQVAESRGTAAAKSTGLGLYIAKNFAQKMGGDLTLGKSEPGQGSVFRLWLPSLLA